LQAGAIGYSNKIGLQYTLLLYFPEFDDDTEDKPPFVFLKSKSEPHRENMKDDYNRIATRALEEKKNDALDSWFIKKIPTYYVMVDEEYKSCPEMAKWTAAANANTASKN